MDCIAGDALPEFMANRTGGCQRGICGSDQGPKGLHGILSLPFQYGNDYGSRGHESEERFEERFAPVYGIESGGPVAIQKIHFQGPDTEPV